MTTTLTEDKIQNIKKYLHENLSNYADLLDFAEKQAQGTVDMKYIAKYDQLGELNGHSIVFLDGIELLIAPSPSSNKNPNDVHRCIDGFFPSSGHARHLAGILPIYIEKHRIYYTVNLENTPRQLDVSTTVKQVCGLMSIDMLADPLGTRPWTVTDGTVVSGMFTAQCKLDNVFLPVLIELAIKKTQTSNSTPFIIKLALTTR